MAPLIPSAKVTLSYPLYACDFDPLDSARLVVGGGGGAGNTGVGNNITLLDTSNPNELVEAAEIELRKDEDNVTSLAVGQKKGNTTLVFAGVNSSSKDLEKGKNSHFRVLGIEPAAKGKGKAAQTNGTHKISEISKSVLFHGKEKDLYQRITRLSKPYPNSPQIGGIATGFAKQSEIVVFDTSATSPPVSRGAVETNKEPVDLDFIQTGDEEYLFAYCDVHDIYLKKFSKDTEDDEPELIYITPATRGTEKPTTPTFRALRFLTKDLLVMLTNIHGNAGAVIQIFRIPPSGKGQCRIAQSLRLPERIKKATGLAVANLTPPPTPTAPQEFTQFVIAVAGHDISLNLFKVDLQVQGKVSMPTRIKAFRTFKEVHPQPITGLCFSNFTPPTHPITVSTPPQHLKLASVGVGNTVVVHTLPLFPVPLSVKRGQSTTPRYVIALPSTAATFGFAIILSILGALLASVFVQSLLEIRGGVPVYLNARNYLPLRLQEALGKPYEFPSGYEAITSTITVEADATTRTVTLSSVHNEAHPTGYNHHIGVPSDDSDAPLAEDGSALRLPEFFEKIQSAAGEGVVIIKDAAEGLKADVHHEDTHGPHGGKTWEELPREQKEGWKKKMIDAGHWAEDMGETILKGVVFGELAGAVGHAVAGG